MHFEDTATAKPSPSFDGVPWWKELTRYQWFVFIVASLGWFFDTMDQQLFNLAQARRDGALDRFTEPAPFVGVRRRARRLCDHDLHDRLGYRRDRVRNSRRSDRPCQDDDPDRLVLLGLHGAECPFCRRLGFRVLSVPDRSGSGRTIRGRGFAGGRGHVGPRAALCARVAAGSFSRRQHARGRCQHRPRQARGSGNHRQCMAGRCF